MRARTIARRPSGGKHCRARGLPGGSQAAQSLPDQDGRRTARSWSGRDPRAPAAACRTGVASETEKESW